MWNTALILAGGIGLRVGSDIPKQYIEVGGSPVIAYCLRVFARHDKINAVQIVADEIWRDFILKRMRADEAGKVFEEKFRGFSAPGRTASCPS